MDDKGDVFNHDEAVCYSDASEDHVDGVPHVPVGEHQDVGKVEQGAQHAHQHCQPAMDGVVELLKGRKMLKSGRFDIKVLSFYNLKQFMSSSPRFPISVTQVDKTKDVFSHRFTVYSDLVNVVWTTVHRFTPAS